jgi:acetyltransferase-like isoleucine patch superfamily enzyme
MPGYAANIVHAAHAEDNEMRVSRLIKRVYLIVRGIPKTLLFNFVYFDVRTALRVPVVVSHRVKLARLDGRVVLGTRPRFGMIRIGFGEVGVFDQDRSRGIWDVAGSVRFDGAAYIGHGSKIAVGTSGELICGAGFGITAESTIYCAKLISFGSKCLLSWHVLVMDTDSHVILARDGTTVNSPEPIRVGDHVWIGCRALVLKGSVVGNDCVVAAGSTVTKMIPGDNQIIGGSPCRVLREGIQWRVV